MISGERYDYAHKIQRLIHLAETDLQAFEKESGMEYSADKENELREIYKEQNLAQIIVQYEEEQRIREQEGAEIQKKNTEQYLAEKKAFEHSFYGYIYKFFQFILKTFVILQVILHGFLQFILIGAAIAGIVIYWMEHYQWTLHGTGICTLLACFAMLILLAIYRVEANYHADDASSIKYTLQYRLAEFTNGRMRVIKHKLFIPLLFSLRHIIYYAVDTIQAIAYLAFMATLIMISPHLLAIAAVVSIGGLYAFNRMCAEDKGNGLLSYLKTKPTALGALLVKLVYSALLLGAVYWCGILDYQAGYIRVLEQIYIFLVNC